MSYSYASAVTGVVTQATTAANILIPIPGSGDLLKFEIWDETQFGLASANTDMLAAWWYRDMLAGSAFVQNRVSGSAAAITTNMVLTNGFTVIDPQVTPQYQAAKIGTTITSADPAVATVTAHGYSNGDIIRITNAVGMQQISGMSFVIGGVTANTFTLLNLDSTQVNLSGATSFVAQKQTFGAFYYPSRKNIVDIGTASAAGVSGAGTSSIITLATANDFTVGQAVRICVPASFVGSGTNPFAQYPGTLGAQSNNPSLMNIAFAVGTITAINTADASGIVSTITVNINSTGFTWQWPTSATAAAGTQTAFVEPIGEAATTMAGTVNPQNLLDDRTRNTGSVYMQLGSSVYGVASDVIRWIAWRGLVTS
jgi:hypothetical protein